MGYPIKSELDRAHKLVLKASALLVMQIVLKKFRPADTRVAYAAMSKAVTALQNLIDGAAPPR